MSYINTKDQQADMLTKALGKTQDDFSFAKLGVLNVFNTSSLRGVLKIAKHLAEVSSSRRSLINCDLFTC